jgi:hypothetical protein
VGIVSCLPAFRFVFFLEKEKKEAMHGGLEEERVLWAGLVQAIIRTD